MIQETSALSGSGLDSSLLGGLRDWHAQHRRRVDRQVWQGTPSEEPEYSGADAHAHLATHIPERGCTRHKSTPSLGPRIGLGDSKGSLERQGRDVPETRSSLCPAMEILSENLGWVCEQAARPRGRDCP